VRNNQEGYYCQSKEEILNQKKYKEIKTILRRGIRIEYSVMLKLRSFVSYSITDSIDQGRVNNLYFEMMKKMNIFNKLKDS
jgi:hypothetical protein